jgi:DinB family protein
MLDTAAGRDDHQVTRDLLRWQFDLTWSLAELHLDRLAADDFLWEPAPHCWTLRQGTDGSWTPDWADTEPDPIPVPTIGWVTWHLGWWWTVAIDHAQGRPPRERTAVAWPGPGAPTVDWLRGLHAEWLAVLDRQTDADLAAPAPFPWPAESGVTVAQMMGWANAELMKNTAELGQLRLLRAAGRPRTR